MHRSPLVALSLLVAGCAAGTPPMMLPDGGDAGPMETDAGPTDAGPNDAGPVDTDAGTDGGAMTDAGADAGATTDAGIDAGPPSDGGTAGTCPALDVGDTLALDGSSDLAKYASRQRLTPGGVLGSSDELAITWDRDYLYATLASPAFTDEFKPLHIYLEVRPSLTTATTASGKEYSSLTAQLPFSATHLIAVRRNSTGGAAAYNGVYTPGGAWTTMTMVLTDGADVWAEGTSAISVRVPWSILGCASAIRMTAHVVNGPVAGNEWKDFVPLTATPWMSPGGGFYEIDLTSSPAVSGWTEI